MKRTPLSDKELQKKAIGSLEFSDEIKSLIDVEEYFIDRCNQNKLFWAYDVNANENVYFETLGYTTWAGTFAISPLQPELTQRQMYDAIRDNCTDTVDFVSYFKSKVNDGVANKYDKPKVVSTNKYEAVVVLPGDNKIKTHICRRKLKWIIQKHGDNVIFKPHPLTRKKTIEQLCDLIDAKKSHFAPIEADLYSLIPEADIVYTSHVSESAIYSTVLGKDIHPIDQYYKRQPSSFGHINYFLFNDFNPIDTINPMLTSYKSGIICPKIEKNWKEKVDKYIDYILNVREKLKDHYVEGDL